MVADTPLYKASQEEMGVLIDFLGAHMENLIQVIIHIFLVRGQLFLFLVRMSVSVLVVVRICSSLFSHLTNLSNIILQHSIMIAGRRF